jgi:hypothetical protein
MPRQSGQICSPRPADAAAGVPPLCEAAVAARRRTSSASMYTPTSRTPEKRSTQRWQTSLRNRVCATRELKSSVATAVRSDCCAITDGQKKSRKLLDRKLLAAYRGWDATKWHTKYGVLAMRGL